MKTGIDYVLVEVVSNKAETDHPRLLLEGIHCARLAHAFLLHGLSNSDVDVMKADPIVIMAIYVDGQMKSQRYLLTAVPPRPNFRSMSSPTAWRGIELPVRVIVHLSDASSLRFLARMYHFR